MPRMAAKGTSKACTQPAARYAECPLANGLLAASGPTARAKREGLRGGSAARRSHSTTSCCSPGISSSWHWRWRREAHIPTPSRVSGASTTAGRPGGGGVLAGAGGDSCAACPAAAGGTATPPAGPTVSAAVSGAPGPAMPGLVQAGEGAAGAGSPSPAAGGPLAPPATAWSYCRVGPAPKQGALTLAMQPGRRVLYFGMFFRGHPRSH